MNTAILSAIADRIIEREGGVEDIGDGAGLTRWGQTPQWLEQYHLPVPRSSDEARANYLTVWTLTKLSEVATEDDELSDIILDYATNRSERAAIKALQALLAVSVDSVIGHDTLDALKMKDRHYVAAHLLGDRIRHYGAIITADPAKHARWAHGWMNRVADLVEKL